MTKAPCNDPIKCSVGTLKCTDSGHCAKYQKYLVIHKKEVEKARRKQEGSDNCGNRLETGR